MVECPNCGETVEEKDIVRCKRCGREYCEECVDVYLTGSMEGEIMCECDD